MMTDGWGKWSLDILGLEVLVLENLLPRLLWSF